MSTESDFEDIKIVRMVDEDVTPLRNDGTPRSDLCRVPFALSRRPPSKWAEIFPIKWDRSLKYALGKQWPGIASVQGDRVVLNGITLDDVNAYLRDLLVSAVAETNKEYRLWKQRQEQRRVKEQACDEEHKRRVSEISERIKFD